MGGGLYRNVRVGGGEKSSLGVEESSGNCTNTAGEKQDLSPDQWV